MSTLIGTVVGSEASSKAFNASINVVFWYSLLTYSVDVSTCMWQVSAFTDTICISLAFIYSLPTELTKLFRVKDEKSAIAFGKSVSGNTREYISIFFEMIFSTPNRLHNI